MGGVFFYTKKIEMFMSDNRTLNDYILLPSMALY